MKTQIRICLTVEFKANFLVFRSAAALEPHLPLVRPGCRTPKADESLLLLDAREWRKMLEAGECDPSDRPASVKYFDFTLSAGDRGGKSKIGV
jgi:hypothetical protein